MRPRLPLCCPPWSWVNSNALRNDLNHPNEYIRGCTLRFLCKLKEQDLIEPLVASIKVGSGHLVWVPEHAE